MKRLHERNAHECFTFHRDREKERIYETDSCQADRVQRSRRMVARVLESMKAPDAAHTFFTIIEAGCGMSDIGGYFSMGHKVIGIEANPTHALSCMKRWEHMDVRDGNIETMEPVECDVLILCETLEHLADPMDFCKRWLPKARHVVISCPINGDLQNDASGGEHTWSINEGDFTDFFKVGGHEIREIERFEMGCYRCWLAAGQRKETANG